MPDKMGWADQRGINGNGRSARLFDGPASRRTYRCSHLTVGPSDRQTVGPSDRRSPSSPEHRVGFTLIEILVVITVIAILAGLVSPTVFRNVGDARVTAAKTQIETFGLALDTYYLHNDHYPSTAQGLAALVQAPTGDPAARNWRGPYLKKGIPLDPWGNAYHYDSPGRVNASSYDLVSLGRNGKPGGEGEDADLTSWQTPAP